MNGLQMIRKIQGNRQSEQLALILKELELKCLLSKEEAVVTIFQKKDFLEVEIDCASQKKESNLKKKLKITPFLEGYQQELLFHPYKGWDKQLNGNLIELKDKK
jgi:hypothetical protein